MRRNHSSEFKAKVALALLKEEKSAAQLAAEHEAHPNQIYRWRAAAIASLPSLFSDQAAQQQVAQQAAHDQLTAQLYAAIDRLTTDRNWLKKSCRSESGRAARVTGAGWRRVVTTAPNGFAGLNRASLYYKAIAPSAAEVARKQRSDAIYTQYPCYGVRRITATLLREGTLVNHKAVRRHMRQLGLLAI